MSLVKSDRFLKTIKFPFFPTKMQEKQLLSWMEKEVWIYNLCLQLRQEKRSRGYGKENYETWKALPKNCIQTGAHAGQFNWAQAMQSHVQEYKKKYPDLAELPAGAITSIIEQVLQGYKSSFENRKKGKITHLSDKTLKDGISIHYRQKDSKIEFEKGSSYAKVFGFDKIAKSGKSLRIKVHRPERLVNGKPGQQRIIKEKDRWYLCVTFDFGVYPTKESHPHYVKEVGVDFGVKRCFQLSDSPDAFLNLPDKDLQYHDERIRVLQRRMAKKRKYSIRWKQLKRLISKHHSKMAEIRKYHTKMIASRLARDYGVVAIENLSIKNMTKSAKGTKEKPGKNVKQKAGLNKAILNHNPHFYRVFQEQKCKEKGSVLLLCPPANTSRACLSCGHIHKNNRLDQATFVCEKCGYTNNADYVGAVNVLRKAKAIEQKKGKKESENAI